jgi:cyclopropane fatty-acyl-phospholipid synthase-like methyltransferase
MKNHTSKSWYRDRWFANETQFIQLYPLPIQQLEDVHWTPLAVAYKALSFLKTAPGVKILDIGSGIGKFCLAGAYYKPQAFFYGVEQRRNLLEHARTAKELLAFSNVEFLPGDFTQVDFRAYDHFYFFNSFGENLTDQYRIDDSIDYSAELYYYYSTYLRNKLDKLPKGTRFVSYCSADDEVPDSYQLVKTLYEGNLKFWIRK